MTGEAGFSTMGKPIRQIRRPDSFVQRTMRRPQTSHLFATALRSLTKYLKSERDGQIGRRSHRAMASSRVRAEAGYDGASLGERVFQIHRRSGSSSITGRYPLDGRAFD